MGKTAFLRQLEKNYVGVNVGEKKEDEMLIEKKTRFILLEIFTF